MITTIEISCNSNGHLAKIPVTAEVFDGFAVHKEVPTQLWVITHVKSGLYCGKYQAQRRAINVAKKLATISINGVPFAQLSGCEALALYPVIFIKIREALKKKISADDLQKGIESAGVVAEFLSCESKGAK